MKKAKDIVITFLYTANLSSLKFSGFGFGGVIVPFSSRDLIASIFLSENI